MGDALDLLGILFSCAEAGRPKRVGVADAEREGAAAEADAMLAASTDMPMRRAARLRRALGGNGEDTGGKRVCLEEHFFLDVGCSDIIKGKESAAWKRMAARELTWLWRTWGWLAR